jgi:hypothetical protein
MALSDIIDGIATLVATATGAGQVLKHFRYAPEEKERQDLYVAAGVLNVVFITREKTEAKDRGAGPKNIGDKHTIALHFYRAIAAGAESEKALQDLVESARDKLHSDRKIGGKGWLHTPVQVPQFVPVMFAGALCWYCKATVLAEEKVFGL